MSRDLLPTLFDRVKGSALGTFVGDVMGRDYVQALAEELARIKARHKGWI
ncbi:MAG: hypothetical protein MUO24_02700 [Desulfobacterales bacterium]|nr:hypothetical protein [Desulfobacterales bacterium]